MNEQMKNETCKEIAEKRNEQGNEISVNNSKLFI